MRRAAVCFDRQRVGCPGPAARIGRAGWSWRVLAAVLAAGVLFPGSGGETAQFRERWRPQFHFTPERNWMNDPNGLVFYRGRYHLFYQHNPWSDRWGHMSWGHAVSRDLVHWEHRPVALWEENETMIFSGSAVVDWRNTSGLGRPGQPALVALYTGHSTKRPHQTQHLAWSSDGGETWTKYVGNPVLDLGEADFRDPKVFWHEPTRRWIMVVAWPPRRQVRFYASNDLRNWWHLGDFGPEGCTDGVWECPDLFPLVVEGVKGRSHWVLVVSVSSGAPAGGSGIQYFVGHFDGQRFSLDPSYPRPQPEWIPEGRLLADFEGDDYGDWVATGSAFGSGPARGTLPNQQMVHGFRGRGLVNTYLGGDTAEGTLTSPSFEITHDFLSFLIGGGAHEGRTCLNLRVDGQVVRSATGENSERLRWHSWDLRPWRGRSAVLEIVDKHLGDWGHVNVDHILLADAPVRPATQPALWADFGRDFYAAVSWSDIPKHDGRRIWLGWMANLEYAGEVPTTPWRGAMTLPRQMSLRRSPDGPRLVQRPVRELRRLRDRSVRAQFCTLAEANTQLASATVHGPCLEIDAEFEVRAETGVFGLEVHRGQGAVTRIECDPSAGRLRLDRRHSGETRFHPAFPGVMEAPLPIQAGRLHLQVWCDTSSIEVFANEGEVVLTALVFPPPGATNWAVFATHHPPQVRRLEAWTLRSIWR